MLWPLSVRRRFSFRGVTGSSCTAESTLLFIYLFIFLWYRHPGHRVRRSRPLNGAANMEVPRRLRSLFPACLSALFSVHSSQVLADQQPSVTIIPINILRPNRNLFRSYFCWPVSISANLSFFQSTNGIRIHILAITPLQVLASSEYWRGSGLTRSEGDGLKAQTTTSPLDWGM